MNRKPTTYTVETDSKIVMLEDNLKNATKNEVYLAKVSTKDWQAMNMLKYYRTEIKRYRAKINRRKNDILDLNEKNKASYNNYRVHQRSLEVRLKKGVVKNIFKCSCGSLYAVNVQGMYKTIEECNKGKCTACLKEIKNEN